MTSLLLLPLPGPEAFAWIVGLLAGASGIALHLLMPLRDPDVAGAVLLASVHP